MTARPDVPGLAAVHRALRAVVAAGTATAGACLVAGLTAFALSRGAAGAPRPGADLRARQADDLTASRGTLVPARAGSAQRLLPGVVVASYRGAALPRRADFQVSPPGTWGLAWAFSCPGGRSGRLAVTEHDGSRPDDPAISASGPAGQGIGWTVGDPGHQFLRIVSDCPWTVRVVLPWRTG